MKRLTALLSAATLLFTACTTQQPAPAGAPAGKNVTASGPAGQKIAFNRVPKPGKYVMDMTIDMDQTIKAEQQPQKQKIAMLMVLSMDVGRPNAQGDSSMSMAYRRFKQDVMQGGKTVLSYDTDLPAENQDKDLGRVLRPMVGATFTVTLAADGTVKSATGLDELWDRLAKENKDDAKMAQMLAGMKKQMGNDMIKQMAGRTAQGLPARPVAVGESWTTDLKMPIPFAGESTMQMTSTLKAVEPGPPPMAVVDYVGKIKAGQGKSTQMEGTELTIDKLEMDMTGSQRIDPATGIAASASSHQKGLIVTTIKTPQTTQTITIEQEGDTVIKIRTEK